MTSSDATPDPTRRLTLKDLPEDERPRERLLQKGPDPLTDAELLAIIIRDGTRSETALDVARRLLHQFGGLRRLAGVSVSDLYGVKGIGPARAAQIKAALALARRLHGSPLRRGERFTSSLAVFEHFHARLRGEPQEHILCLLLDAKNRIIKEVSVAIGGLSAALAQPRDILRAAVAEAANAMILIHNHPSGDPAPSPDDLRITHAVKQAAELAGIRFLDHIIIGDEGYVSLSDTGRL